MTKKVTEKMLMELMESFLKEREYASGSRMPTQKGEYIELPPHFRAIHSRQDVEKGLITLEKYCQAVMNIGEPPKFAKDSISKTFNRMIAVEYLHKFLLQISNGQETFSDTKKLGFGMENLLVNLLGGKIISGEIDDIAISSKGQKVRLSIKLLSTGSLKNYGVKQSYSFVESWLNNKRRSNTVNYLVFEKLDSGANIGVRCYSINLTYKEIESKYDEAKSNEIEAVVFAKLEDLGEPFATIELPKNLDAFLEGNFQSIEQGISLLYKSLDGFRDSVANWIQSDQADSEAQIAKSSLKILNKNAKII
jgi:hypothetical protein